MVNKTRELNYNQKSYRNYQMEGWSRDKCSEKLACVQENLSFVTCYAMLTGE
jgi:hypothetical protein